MRLTLLIVFLLSLIFCMAAPSRAMPLPPRPTEERLLPLGFQEKTRSGDAQCFLLPEWKELAHIIVDYRLLVSWAAQTEALYSAEGIRVSVADATAKVALASQQAALARERASLAKAEKERKKAQRRGWLAASLGLAAIVLGGVVVGVVAGK